MVADVVTEFIEGLVETYPGLQYLDGFPQVIDFFNFCLFTVQYFNFFFVHMFYHLVVAYPMLYAG